MLMNHCTCVSAILVVSGSELTPLHLRAASPMERDTSMMPHTRPSLTKPPAWIDCIRNQVMPLRGASMCGSSSKRATSCQAPNAREMIKPHLFYPLLFLQYHGLVVLADRKRVQLFRIIGFWGGISCCGKGCVVVFALFSARKNASGISQPSHKAHTLVNEQRYCAATATASSLASW